MASRSKVTLFKTLGAVMERLPERFDVSLAQRLSMFVGRHNRSARENLRTNVAHALRVDTDALDAGTLEHFVDRGFESYGRYWAEGAKLPGIKPERVFARFRIGEGLEYLYDAKAQGLGTIIALPHIGSWEWGGSFLNSLGLGMTAIAEDLEPPALFAWFKEKRESIGIRIEPLDEHAGTVLLETLRGGGVIGLLSDRDIQGNGIEVEFFGERVRLPGGPATLALRTGATLVAAACYSGPGRDHFAVITPPIRAERLGRLREDVTRVTQALASELEGLIRRAPEQWHVLQPRFDRP
ncbi:MAG TPA: phosphatidylinositol mannoside acyltransferase [Acidimicrobiales bacterium]|nr:phosphatidylinositol mannoside acyltransferase [Acidimicrobiales bacterium]